jgi:hypothetical protein
MAYDEKNGKYLLIGYQWSLENSTAEVGLTAASLPTD